MKLTILIPCYNSGQTIKRLVDETIEYLDKLKDFEYEFILVNDGSNDNTFSEIISLTLQYRFVTGIDLAKNCGQHNAILAGLNYATGDYILGMDDDLQTHPSQIHKLIEKIEEGYDVVYGKYEKRKHNMLRNLGSKFNDLTMRWLLNSPKDLTACSLYIVRRFIRDEIIKSKSRFTNLRGLFLRSTSRITNVSVEHFDRGNGKSTYNVKKLFLLWSSFINYSMKPIRLVFICGLLLAVAGGVFWILTGFVKMSGNHVIIAAVAFFTGLLMMSAGIIGEYIGRMFQIQNAEPQYVIREIARQDETEEEPDEKNTDSWSR